MADGQVVFEIVGDSKGIDQTVKQVTSNIQNESKKWDKAAGDATNNIEKSFSGMAGKIVASLGAAGVASILLNWGKAAVDAASDLAEVQNVVDTVFGDGARQIESWAKAAGQQFGLTETQAKKFTSTLGAMAKSAGLAGPEIVTMSTDLAGLAADMASFYNLDFETAFEKIRSGISGETMPLKQLGINMSVANLEAFALAQGLEKTFSEMSQGEQTMLRYQYLMQATSDAQGDFSKTADGFANAQRRIESSIDSIKTSIGTILLPWVEKAVSGVASFLDSIASSMMPEKTVIDEFNEIKVDTESKLQEIEKTYQSASDLIKILKEIEQETVTLKDGTTVSLTSIFGDIAEIEKNGGDVQGYIESLGLDVDYVVLKYNEWKEATRQLTSLVPSLTSQINSETGAIDGGTDALQKNLEEWKRNEENKIYWAEYYAKAEAVARAKGEQAGLQITAKARQMEAERVKAEVDKLAKELNITPKADGSYATLALTDMHYSNEDVARWNAALDRLTAAISRAAQAQRDADQSASDLANAEELLADELKATEAITGQTAESMQKIKSAGEDAEEGFTITKEGAKAAADAIKAVTDYYQGMLDATAQAVNSTIKGFEHVGMAADDLRKKSSDLADEETQVMSEYTDVWTKWGSDAAALKKMAENWDSLTETEQEAYNALVKIRNAQNEVNESMNQYKPEGMQANLQSQIEFMDNYLKNLNQLKEWGVSDEMLASLSDGSKESAEYLQGLVEGGKDAAVAVGNLYEEVQGQKDEFTQALTDQKLTADETYQSLVDNAMQAIEDLDLGDEAQASLYDTIEGMAEGIREAEPDVAAAVDSILDELNRLNFFGLGFDFDLAGNLAFFMGDLFGGAEGFAGGLDYVPYNNMPAFLHEGEAVLTAEENMIWQRFKNGQPDSMDYDALGGVMRDNVKAGGNVYLDGRTVGQVVSDMQGRSYRNLQRSGWQG